MQHSDSDDFGSPVANPGEGNDLQAFGRIDSAMQAFVDDRQVPGLLCAVVHKGRLIKMLTQGYRDVKLQQPMTSDTLFRWYSLTKPITAAATMLLVDEGRLALDSPVAEWLPAIGRMKVSTGRRSVPADRQITVADLLTHRAGLSYAADFQAWGFSESHARLSEPNLESYIARLASFPLITQPGEEWRFSDGYSVLARVIEIITGRRYGDFLRERIFQPLGMTDTGYWVPWENADRLCKFYVQSQVDGGIRETESFGGDYTLQPGLEAGGSGLVGSAADYLRFARMLLNRGELDGVRVLSENAVHAMFTDYLAGDSRRSIPEGRHAFFTGMGMGLGGYVVYDANKRGIAGANGQYRCYGLANTFFWIDPEHELVGLCFTQVVDRVSSLRSIRNAFHRLTYESLAVC